MRNFSWIPAPWLVFSTGASLFIRPASISNLFLKAARRRPIILKQPIYDQNSIAGYSEVLKELNNLIEGTPRVQTYNVANSTPHRIAARPAA